MRRPAVLPLLLTVALVAPVAAKKTLTITMPPSTPKAASTARPSTPADAPTLGGQRLRGSSTGAAQSVKLSSPTAEPVNVDSGKRSPEQAPDRLAPTATRDAPPPDGDLILELVQKQMRRHQPSIEKCRQAALKISPNLSGTVVLGLRVDDHKVVESSVKGDTIANEKLNQCLLQTSRTWAFGVAAASFQWEVDVQPLQ